MFIIAEFFDSFDAGDFTLRRDWNIARIRCDALNAANVAVAKKAGYVFEGTIRHDYPYPDGSVGDIMNWSKLKSELAAQK